MRVVRRVLALVAGVAAGAVTAGAACADGDTWSVPDRATITITGHGWGHGHGMSQYGARGAARQGLTWQRIVGFYYPGTTIARAGGSMRVLITADTTRDIVVDARPTLRLHRLGGRTVALHRVRPQATRWRILPVGRRTRVEYRRPGSHGWLPFTAFPGTAEFAAGRRPITLHLPGRATARYRGTLRSVAKRTVDVVPLEDYLRGVVPAEMPPTWEQQAVQAQAVAARTYAVFERSAARGAGAGYDLCDTSACQVYGGVDVEQPGSDDAVRHTAHRVVDYQGAPAFTQFSSSDGGWNAAGSTSYLVAQQDPYEAASDNPYATWTATLGAGRLQQAFPQIGDLERVTLADRDGHGDWGGRVGTVTLSGSAGSVTISGDAFRLGLGLRSTWFTVTSVSG